MLDRIPLVFKVLAFAGVCLMGPVIVLSFLFGGIGWGLGAALAFVFFFMVLYMWVVRRYIEPPS